MASYADCFQLSAQCPVKASALGYVPSLQANATFLAVFSLITVAQLIKGIVWKTWGFMTAFVLGSLLEIIGEFEVTTYYKQYLLNKGYSARLILYSNPWSRSGQVTKLTITYSATNDIRLIIQKFCLTIGPLLYSAGIYLCYSYL
jgi:hypothetical protein